MMHPQPGQRDHFIDGAWRPAVSGARMAAIDPSTGQEICDVAAGDAQDVDLAVAAARRALAGPWGRLGPAERGRQLVAMASRIAVEAEPLARLEALNVGKPLGQARKDVRALLRYLEFYAGAADKFGGETIPFANGFTAFTIREPLGVVGAIIPWNYPLQIFGRSVGAALAAGNAVVLKPSEFAPLTCLAVARLAAESGLPDGAINVVMGEGSRVGAALASHPKVAHISFTGSAIVGSAVQAAAASHAASVTLELGGKSPQIVFADADLERALPAIVNSGVQNAGQTCSAASRILVERPIYDQLLDGLASRYSALRAGPALADLDVGPLISRRQVQRVRGIIDRARAIGVEIVAEGAVDASASSNGFFLAPTLFGEAPQDSELAREEIFGPVQALIPFTDEAEALAIANCLDGGLVAGVWTANGARAMRMARALRAGQVFINDYGAGGGIELPFGGVGTSGHGREKGLAALAGFTVIKTIAIHHG
jgi:aldehyde dehydrogenase (NAD+)